jgi:photosystem II stability/assembly factor-like uncharacterized protein
MKKILLGVVLFLVVPVLSGCALPQISGTPTMPAVSFMRSNDSGASFESKSTIDAKTDFASAGILSMAFGNDTRHIVVGTKESGMFSSNDSGDSWHKLNYKPLKVYGLVIDKSDDAKLFATGVWQNRSKIYQSNDHGDNWTEIYTEPANSTIITALAQDPFHPKTLYAGTSAGMVIRTSDGGATWKNIDFTQPMTGHIIWKIVFDSHAENRLYFLVESKGVYLSDGEKLLVEPSSNILGAITNATPPTVGNIFSQSKGNNSKIPVSLALDTSKSGTLYITSSQGILRSQDFGKSFEALNVIESSKKFPITALAINPKNSNEIVYITALTFYKSTDGGTHWTTASLMSDKPASFLQYDQYAPSILYIGFK